MYAKFKNGVVKECDTPTEQMIFRNSEPVGWLAVLSLNGINTSDEAENLLCGENISSIAFFDNVSETDNSEPLFALNDYTSVQSAVVYHNSINALEIQLKKPLKEVINDA